MHTNRMMIGADAVGEDGGGFDSERVRDEDVIELAVGEEVRHAAAKRVA